MGHVLELRVCAKPDCEKVFRVLETSAQQYCSNQHDPNSDSSRVMFTQGRGRESKAVSQANSKKRDAVIDRMRALTSEGKTMAEVEQILPTEGLVRPDGKPYTAKHLSQLKWQYGFAKKRNKGDQVGLHEDEEDGLQSGDDNEMTSSGDIKPILKRKYTRRGSVGLPKKFKLKETGDILPTVAVAILDDFKLSDKQKIGMLRVYAGLDAN